MTWFHPRDWYQKEITFPGEPTVIWVLEEKLSEKFNQRTEERSLAAAWAVFLCKRKDGHGKKHAMKIWIHIPYTGTEFTPNQVRKSQARSHHGSSPDKSTKALDRLRQTASVYSPRLVHLLYTQQDENDMVPTGFITYVLMTWCPGSLMSDDTWFSMPLAEKYAVREAFKNAWEDAKKCGVVSWLPNREDLLWDSENTKCYMTAPTNWSEVSPDDQAEDFYDKLDNIAPGFKGGLFLCWHTRTLLTPDC